MVYNVVSISGSELVGFFYLTHFSKLVLSSGPSARVIAGGILFIFRWACAREKKEKVC